MNALSLRFQCRRCHLNMMMQRKPVPTETSKRDLSSWSVWAANIAQGHDPAFKPVDVHVCEDGRTGVADFIGVELTAADSTRHVMTDDEIAEASTPT